MTSFWSQLKLLLWKNYVLRKRHKMRIVLEILWPLFLFLILMWVRTRGLKLKKPACHVMEKALPSIGGFKFLQNYLCGLNNTCFSSTERGSDGNIMYAEDDGGKMWDKAALPVFMRDTSPLLIDILERPEGVETLQKMWLDIKKGLHIAQGAQMTEIVKGMGTIKVEDLLKPKVTRDNIVSIITSYSTFSEELVNDLLDSEIHLDQFDKVSYKKMYDDLTTGTCDTKASYKLVTFKSDELFTALCSSSRADLFPMGAILWNYLDRDGLAGKILQSLETDSLGILPDIASYDGRTKKKLFDLARIVREFMISFEDLFENNNATTSTPGKGDKDDKDNRNDNGAAGFAAGTRLLYRTFCGISVNPNASVFGIGSENTDSYDTLRDRLRDWKNKKPYRPDHEVSALCNQIFEQLELRPFTSLLWKQIKPFIRGKILYYPQTDFTDSLMKKVDARFYQLHDLFTTFNAALSTFHRVRNWFNFRQEDLVMAQDRLKQPGSLELLKQFMAKQMPESEMKPLLDVLESFKYLDLNQTYALLGNLDFNYELESEVLSCVRYNKSTPYKQHVSAKSSRGKRSVTNDSEPFRTEEEAVKEGMGLLGDNNLWAVVIFLDLPEDGSAPRHLKYKIRMDSDKVDGTRFTRDRLTRKTPRRRPTIDLKYLTNGFIYLQEMIDHSFVEETTGVPLTGMGFLLQQFPFPCHIYDQFIRAISNTFPLFMVLSWVYASAMIVKSVVLEKEFRLKEVMKVMGCGNSVIWTAWFLDNFAVMSVSSIILSLILKYGKIVEHSDITLIIFLMITFSIATICFSFFISTFFNRANSAAAAGGILFFVTYLPYNFMLIWEDRLTWYHMLSSCLLSNVAFGFGCTYLARLEEDGIGAQWDRITMKTLPDDDFNLSYCLLMLIFDSFVYLMLTLYIEAVFPGSSGVPKPWYFMFQKSFWRSRSLGDRLANDSYENFLPIGDTTDADVPILEPEPEDTKCGVSVRNLSKVYPNGRVALKNLNLAFYEGQITSFLGHNGAGKTTTISILTGLFPPTSGTAKIYGRDIRTEIDSIRKDLGVCPQFNVLFDRLTVEEHMLFYAGLKGKGDIMKEEMDQMLFDLGIPHKKKDFPSNLSGGMKRKLSVAIAFVGGSKTVFLDEPTSGVDPYSRRSIWELLLKYKEGRTIILTTHFMDEADLLGDRIAIISQGKLKACGSSLFLKSHFGQGYSFRMVKKEQGPTDDFLLNNIIPADITVAPLTPLVPKEKTGGMHAEATVPPTGKVAVPKAGDVASTITGDTIHKPFSTNSARLTDLYKSFVQLRIPEAVLIDDVGSDVVFLLPYSTINAFPTLFQDIDDSLENLKISSYGISDTTLEDVFLQITVEDLDNNAGDTKEASSTCHGYCYTRRLWSAVWRMRASMRKKKKKNCEVQDVPRVIVVAPRDQGEPGADTVTNPSLSAYSRVDYSGTLTIDVDDTDLSETEPEGTGETLLPVVKSEHDMFGTKRVLRPYPLMQAWIIILKRFRNSNRNKKSIFFEIILPALFIALTLTFTLILPPPENEAVREMTYETYKPPNNIFFSAPKILNGTFGKTIDELIGPVGPGTTCTRDSIKKDPMVCHPKEWSSSAVQRFNRARISLAKPILGTCSCDSGAQLCEDDVEKVVPPRFKTPSRDYILDVSKYNLPEWISRTYFKYESKRYGGYEMLLRAPEDITLTEYVSLLDKFTSMKSYVRQPKPVIKEFYKVWFENRGWVSSVAYLNALNNMILRQSVQNVTTEKDQYGITIYTHPLNLTAEQQKKESIKTAALGVIHAICIIFALSFVPASFTVYLIEERKSGAKHLHLVSGVKPITYWFSNFTFDFVKYLFSALLCVCLFVAFDANAYIGKDSAAAFISLLVLYGFASIPLMYPASFMFSVPSTAFVVLACANLFIGVITTVSTFVLDQLGDEELKKIGLVLQDVFLVFPHYCLGRGLIELVKLHVEATAFGKISMDTYVRNRFEWQVLGKMLTCLGIHGITFFVFNLTIEYRQWCYLLCCKMSMAKKRQYAEKARLGAEEDDEDVKREIERVIHHSIPNATLRAECLFKIYHGKKTPAVNNLCFAVEPGECFGLLGVNGAGKSTTFKMLTGDSRITSGRAEIMDLDIETNLDEARKHYGYCPQEDGIDPLLNAYEQLELYGRLRGLTKAEVQKTAIQLVNSLGLKRYSDKRCGTYSGGNKRKVSTAIALIGNPDLVFLDEPTSGMDPGARRQLWKLILQITHMGKSVVLTSHSMEECEALCTRLAIMVNGKFTCLGSLQHLKNRFGTGYMLTVRCDPIQQEDFIRSVSTDLPSAKLDDVHCSQLKFNIIQDKVKLGEIFDVMCSAKALGVIEDFSVSQTTLDDIFVKFASRQRDDMDVRPKVDVVPRSVEVIPS